MSTGEKRLGRVRWLVLRFRSGPHGCSLTTFDPRLGSRNLVCGNGGSLGLIRLRFGDNGDGFASQRIDGRQGFITTYDNRTAAQHFVLHVVFPGAQFDFNGSELLDVMSL